MPEWPDLHVLRKQLAVALVGRTALAAEVHNPIVIRTVRPLPEVLAGHRLEGITHRGNSSWPNSHVRVRGRENTPCPRCGTRIVLRSLGYLETNFCPKCQPAPPGQLY